jgi:pentapeptide MXKDX repeat protein
MPVCDLQPKSQRCRGVKYRFSFACMAYRFFGPFPRGVLLAYNSRTGTTLPVSHRGSMSCSPKNTLYLEGEFRNMKKLLTLVFAVALAFSLSSVSFAQDASGQGMSKDKQEMKKEKKEKKASKKKMKKEKKSSMKKDEMKKDDQPK